MNMTNLIPVLLASAILVAGCSPSAPPPADTPAPAAKVPLSAMPKIEPAPLLEHIRVLSSDEFEGRKPGTPGEERTVQYPDW